MWPLLTTPLPTPLFIVTASPLPYSRMIFEATCGTISELDLTKLSSKFSTLASPHATQSTSSEDYPKGVVSARPYSEYSSLILFTNSEPNSPSCYLPWTPTAKPTHPPSQMYHAHLDCRTTLCWWPSPHVNMSARTASYASCLSTLEHSKSHAN